MKSENATKEDIKKLDTKLDFSVKKLNEKIDDLKYHMDNMFEKLTTVILEAVDSVSEKNKQESHENTLRIVEIERDRYSVLFEMNADHEAKIKNIDRRVQVLELA